MLELGRRKKVSNQGLQTVFSEVVTKRYRTVQAPSFVLQKCHRGRLPDRRRGHGHFARGRLSLVAESRGRSCSRSGKGRLAPPIPVTPKFR
jgi:hypothetical protein